MCVEGGLDFTPPHELLHISAGKREGVGFSVLVVKEAGQIALP
jgi:hypothetical protein